MTGNIKDYLPHKINYALSYYSNSGADGIIYIAFSIYLCLFSSYYSYFLVFIFFIKNIRAKTEPLISLTYSLITIVLKYHLASLQRYKNPSTYHFIDMSPLSAYLMRIFEHIIFFIVLSLFVLTTYTDRLSSKQFIKPSR